MWHLRLLLLLKRYGRTLAQHSHTLGDYHLASLESRAHDVVLTIVLRYLDNLRHGLAIDWLVYIGLILHLEGGDARDDYLIGLDISENHIARATTKEVLANLNIKENTLKYHNRNIYSKLGVSSRKELLELYKQIRCSSGCSKDTQ